MSADAAAGAPPFRFRFVPTLTVVLLGLGLPWLAAELVDYARHYSHLVPGIADKLGWLYAQHGVQLVLALIAISVMRWLVPADYGLHVPQDRSYLVPAILCGLLLGALTAAVVAAPSLIAGTPLRLGHAPDAAGMVGWLAYCGLVLGPSDEILFRALLVTYLAVTMPGRLRLLGFEISGAGVVVAALYALYDAGFVTQPFAVALGITVLGFVAATLYAYFLERSKSVLAPAAGHGVAAAAQYLVLLFMAAA